MDETVEGGLVAQPAAGHEGATAAPNARHKKETGASFVTKRARLRFTLQLRPQAAKLFVRYESLRSLGSDQKDALRAVVRKSILLHLYARAMGERVDMWARMIAILALFVGSFFATAALTTFLPGVSQGRNPETGSAVVEAFFGLLTFTLIGIGPLILLEQFISARAQTYIAFQRIFQWAMFAEVLACLVASSSLIMVARARPLDGSEMFLLHGSLAYIIYYGGFLAVVGPALAAVRAWLERRVQRTYTSAFLVAEFFTALADVERKTPEGWADMSFRKEVITRLEKLATCIERVLPSRMYSGNAATDQWLAETAEEIAAGVRALSKWVMTPKPDTREQLVARLALNLGYVARGDWDGFQRVKPERLSRPDLIRTRGANLLRATALASIPILLLLAVKRLGLAPDGTVLTYLTVGGYVWAALTLLSGLDPAYGAKLTAMKDITGLLPLPGKGKSE